jgi:cytochrome P450
MTDYSAHKTKKIMRRGKTPKALQTLEDRIITRVEKAVDEAVAKQK